MKYTLPVRPFFTSRVISARASSTSARTRVDTWVVASLIRSPIDGSADLACGSANGIVVRVLGTPFLRSTLLTDGPLGSIARLAVHVAMRCHARRGQPKATLPGAATGLGWAEVARRRDGERAVSLSR